MIVFDDVDVSKMLPWKKKVEGNSSIGSQNTQYMKNIKR